MIEGLYQHSGDVVKCVGKDSVNYVFEYISGEQSGFRFFLNIKYFSFNDNIFKITDSEAAKIMLMGDSSESG